MSIIPPKLETLTMAVAVSQNRPSMQFNRPKAVNSFDAALADAKENTAPQNNASAKQTGKNFLTGAPSTQMASNPVEPDGLSKVMAALEQERFMAFLLMKLGHAPTDQGADMDIAAAAMPIALPKSSLKAAALPSSATDNIPGNATPDKARKDAGPEDIGRLSARFESGDQGPGAIGYDEAGGTSYGTYQISSRQGTFDRFVSFLDKAAPNYAARLRAAGNPDTGGRQGKVPQEWQRIAKEDPRGFEALQRQFIKETHYGPALQKVAQSTGLDLSERSSVLKEVLWSTSVQHGPDGAAKIFKKALEGLKARGDVSDQAIIDTVYDIRRRQFDSSAPQVQQAVTRRFSEERVAVVGVLKDGISA